MPPTIGFSQQCSFTTICVPAGWLPSWRRLAAANNAGPGTEDRDAAITQALSGLAEAAQVTPISEGTRDIRATDSEGLDKASSLSRRLSGGLTRAADRDRTGIISLEG
jgi:hypothetical protein